MTAIVRDFLSTYILGVIALVVIGWALATYAGVELPGGISVVPFVIGVQIAAQRFATRAGRAPTSGEAWRGALAMTASAIALSVLLFVVLILAFGAESIFGPDFAAVFNSTLAMVVLAIIFVVYVLMARFAFSWMARAAVRNAGRMKNRK